MTAPGGEINEALRQARAAHQRLDTISERVTKLEAGFEYQLSHSEKLLQQLVESQASIPKTLARLDEQVRQLGRRLDDMTKKNNSSMGGSWVVMSLGWLFALVMFILRLVYKN